MKRNLPYKLSLSRHFCLAATRTARPPPPRHPPPPPRLCPLGRGGPQLVSFLVACQIKSNGPLTWVCFSEGPSRPERRAHATTTGFSCPRLRRGWRPPREPAYWKRNWKLRGQNGRLVENTKKILMRQMLTLSQQSMSYAGQHPWLGSGLRRHLVRKRGMATPHQSMDLNKTSHALRPILSDLFFFFQVFFFWLHLVPAPSHSTPQLRTSNVQ